MKNTDLQVLFNENLVQSILEFSKELIVNRTVTKHLHDMAKIHKEGKGFHINYYKMPKLKLQTD